MWHEPMPDTFTFYSFDSPLKWKLASDTEEMAQKTNSTSKNKFYNIKHTTQLLLICSKEKGFKAILNQINC